MVKRSHNYFCQTGFPKKYYQVGFKHCHSENVNVLIYANRQSMSEKELIKISQVQGKQAENNMKDAGVGL